ncbi:hypothetical protein D3C75_987680 [compost metagenome]
MFMVPFSRWGERVVFQLIACIPVAVSGSTLGSLACDMLRCQVRPQATLPLGSTLAMSRMLSSVKARAGNWWFHSTSMALFGIGNGTWPSPLTPMPPFSISAVSAFFFARSQT